MYGVIDVGGTKLLAAVTGDDGRVGPSLRRPTPADDPAGCLATMLDEVRGGHALEGIALAVPGPFDRELGALRDPPNVPPAWRRVRLADELRARFGCPVVLENDANCAALAEADAGAGAGLETVVYYTVSTGVGTGVVRRGELLAGRHDTEGGHQVLWPGWLGGPACLCGGAGCLEALASGSSIHRRFGRAAEDLDDQHAWDDVGRWLGLAVTNTVALYDPDAVLFGGGVCAAWHRFWPSMSQTIEATLRLQRRPLVALGSLGEERNLLGALLAFRLRHGA